VEIPISANLPECLPTAVYPEPIMIAYLIFLLFETGADLRSIGIAHRVTAISVVFIITIFKLIRMSSHTISHVGMRLTHS
jgi:hypothetical protein